MQPCIILDLDLTKLEPGEVPLQVQVWTSSNPGLARVGSWGGSALGVALLHAEVEPVPLVLAVGSAVMRQLPTAARLSVLSRAPLTGRFAEGHIGGALGPNLAGLVDALLLRGRTMLPGAVLTLGADGRGRLESRPELVGCSPVEVWRRLKPAGALMSVGLGAELGLPYALLAGGSLQPSFSGRGGLGAVFGALGLKALVIEAQSEPRGAPKDKRVEGLHRALVSSPRLAARAAGGSMELYARQDDRGAGSRLAHEAAESAREQQGCRGCPTPCGWVFERADGQRQKGHFNANRALGQELGLHSFDASLALLARCDAYGLDAREVGSMLSLLVRAEQRAGESALFGNPENLLGAIDGMLGRGSCAAGLHSSDFRHGSLALARRLGLQAQGPHIQGQAAHPDVGLAGLLGQAVSCGGADPMRSFPFLVDALGRAGLDRVCRALAPLPEGAEDPESSVAKGRLVAWHENLVAAVDAFGFCVFSAAGLLADGISNLESIAGWLLPEELRAAAPRAWAALDLDQRLLAAGANIVELRRSLDRRLRAMPMPAGLSSAPALDGALLSRLEQPGMLPEYLRCRRDDDDLAALANPLETLKRDFPRAPSSPARLPDRRVPGSVGLQATGPLGALLGQGSLRVNLQLPALLSDVLQAACQVDPRLARQLFMGPAEERIPLPSAWRAGRRLKEGEWIEAGDELLLISVLAGG